MASCVAESKFIPVGGNPPSSSQNFRLNRKVWADFAIPVRQERVAAGGVLCYILKCVCGYSLKKARALPLERNHQASSADGLRMYGNRYSLCLPDAGEIRPVGLFTRPAHYPAADAALPAADGGADAAVAHTADAEIQRCYRPGGGAVRVVPLLPADAVSPAAGGVHRPVHGKVRGLPPEPRDRYAVDHPCGTVSAGDHQRPASAGICLQKRRPRLAGFRHIFLPLAVFYLPWLDGGLYGFFPCLPVPEEPYPKW